MSLLEIRKYPDPVLKKKALPVDEVDGKIQKLIDDMLETMYAAPGIGLAAPQVGKSIKLAVLDISISGEEHPPIILINPEIVKSEGKTASEEGCLSIPGYTSVIERAGSVTVTAINREGLQTEIEATGLLARALQHEIDHLDGKLFIDRMSPVKKDFFRKRYSRILKAV